MAANSSELIKLLHLALKEDAPRGDITSEFMLDTNRISKAKIITRESGVFYGDRIIYHLMNIIDPNTHVTFFKRDGDRMKENEAICEIHGTVKSILLAERVMLNFIQRLSGVASITNRFVTFLKGSNIKVFDTRKTTPMMRFLEKDAVLAGGGTNHRDGLSDMVLLKENHIQQFIAENKIHLMEKKIQSFKKAHPKVKVEIEIESCEQLKSYDLSRVDYIMLDNFELSDIKRAVAICKENQWPAEIEISGNVNLSNIQDYKELPIDRISIGCLTHSVPAVDMSLLFSC